jgi:hypothetical protein
METPSPREMRLRLKYAGLYPEMQPETWIAASRWAKVIVARSQQARLQGRHERTFDPRHFEFRGGSLWAWEPRPPTGTEPPAMQR